MSRHIAIENPDHVCFNCLKELSIDQLHNIVIPSLAWGSRFDNWSTQIQLCNECFEKTNLKWWELEEVFDDSQFGGSWYKYEDEIFNYVNTLPIEGQELFYNRYSYGYGYCMEPQDWIDYKLDLLSHDKCKEYGLYSPEERQAYQERFPICEHVQLIEYKDGSKSCKCIRGAFGKEDGTVIEHQTQTECYNCTRFKVREGAMLTVNMKEEEIKRTKRQIRELATKLRELED